MFDFQQDILHELHTLASIDHNISDEQMINTFDQGENDEELYINQQEVELPYQQSNLKVLRQCRRNDIKLIGNHLKKIIITSRQERQNDNEILQNIIIFKQQQYQYHKLTNDNNMRQGREINKEIQQIKKKKIRKVKNINLYNWIHRQNRKIDQYSSIFIKIDEINETNEIKEQKTQKQIDQNPQVEPNNE